MDVDPTPRIGDWYRNSIGDTFEIVAQDEDDDTLELQYYDGTVEELDAETWNAMQPESIEPPEDWRGSMDLSREDAAAPEESAIPGDWMTLLERGNAGAD
ncbi:MAG TPA: hypothetical protein ENK05_11345 [Gammaproteobacteria bacterium]|nr:hypothetical protein [Gammaproteobacteria bacterium]